MKRTATGLAIALPLLLGQSGCASVGGGHEVDAAKVASVERAALRHGLGLVWVNPPTKKVAAPAGS